MAKSGRASGIKKNNSRLRSKVFGPVEQARAERLNKKLLELAQAPKPSDATKMEVEAPPAESADNDMRVTGEEKGSKSKTAIKKARDAKQRAGRRRGRKESNKMVFAGTHNKSKVKKR